MCGQTIKQYYESIEQCVVICRNILPHANIPPNLSSRFYSNSATKNFKQKLNFKYMRMNQLYILSFYRIVRMRP